MNKVKYLLLSDIHAHEWTLFADTDENGVNSRLRIICDAILEADAAGYAAGCTHMIIAGDLFHNRGELTPVVINMVKATLEKCKITQIYVLSGNHDETKDDSDNLFSAVSLVAYDHPCKSIEAVVDKPYVTTFSSELGVAMFPWRATTEQLLEDMRAFVNSTGFSYPAKYDAIIHVGVDGVLAGLEGISAHELSQLGFNRVFAGHYHNHKEVVGGVYSIGALTHQTWRDVGSKAGYMIIDEESEMHFETSAPKFLDFDDTMVDGTNVTDNYIRIKSQCDDKSDVLDIKADLKDFEPAGVQVHPGAKKQTVRVENDLTLETTDDDAAIAQWVDWAYGEDDDKEEVAAYCKEIYEQGRSD